MPLVLDGNGDITGLVTGALPSTVIGAGAVLQVVNGTVNYVTTTSASLTDTGLSATITPTSSASRVLVLLNLVSINPAFSAAANWAFVLTDGSNNVVQNLINYNTATGNGMLQGASYCLLLSPATTSSITYKVRYSVSGGYQLRLGDYSANTNPSTITLLEIAG
jgi:hypothetical protein